MSTTSKLASMSAIYSHHSTLQNSAIQYSKKSLIPLMKDKIAGSSSTQLFKVADFGSATGENSQIIMRELVEKAIESNNTPIELTFCDVPSNNFSQLFSNFADEPLFNQPNVYVQGVGRSFYQKNFADEQLDISYSSTAYHWLDSSDTSSEIALAKESLKNSSRPHITYHALPDQDRQRFYDRVVSRDFERNIKLRYQELKRGGMLVIINPCRPSGETHVHQIFPNSTSATNIAPHLELTNQAALKLMNDGLITQLEYNRFLNPWWLGSPEEYLQPIEKYFDVVQQEIFLVPGPVSTVFSSSGRHVYADRMAGHIRAYSEHVFMGSLNSDRSDKQTVTDQFYSTISQIMNALSDDQIDLFASVPMRYIAIVAVKSQ